jgi:hypothetical protein
MDNIQHNTNIKHTSHNEYVEHNSYTKYTTDNGQCPTYFAHQIYLRQWTTSKIFVYQLYLRQFAMSKIIRIPSTPQKIDNVQHILYTKYTSDTGQCPTYLYTTYILDNGQSPTYFLRQIYLRQWAMFKMFCISNIAQTIGVV